MTVVLLTTLFTLAALVAGATIAHSLRGVAGDYAGAKAALAGCPQTVWVDYRIAAPQLHRGTAKVLVLPVRRPAVWTIQPELRAAA